MADSKSSKRPRRRASFTRTRVRASLKGRRGALGFPLPELHDHEVTKLVSFLLVSGAMDNATDERAREDIVLPDDVAREKVQMLEALGAEVEKGLLPSLFTLCITSLIDHLLSKVRPVSIVDKRHYVNLARIRALEFGKGYTISSTATAPSTTPPSELHTHPTSSSAAPPDADLVVTSAPPSDPSLPSALENIFRDPPRGLFADQFENLSNLAAHHDGTAPEIWRQTSGVLDAFVSGAGTGGEGFRFFCNSASGGTADEASFACS